MFQLLVKLCVVIPVVIPAHVDCMVNVDRGDLASIQPAASILATVLNNLEVDLDFDPPVEVVAVVRVVDLFVDGVVDCDYSTVVDSIASVVVDRTLSTNVVDLWVLKIIFYQNIRLDMANCFKLRTSLPYLAQVHVPKHQLAGLGVVVLVFQVCLS